MGYIYNVRHYGVYLQHFLSRGKFSWTPLSITFSDLSLQGGHFSFYHLSTMRSCVKTLDIPVPSHFNRYKVQFFGSYFRKGIFSLYLPFHSTAC
jgi:hypothetical protein